MNKKTQYDAMINGYVNSKTRNWEPSYQQSAYSMGHAQRLPSKIQPNFYVNVPDDVHYIQPGSFNSAPPNFNMEELKHINGVIQSKSTKYKGNNKSDYVIDAMGENPNLVPLEGGKFNLKKTLKKVGKVVKPIASKVLDVGVPLVGKVLGNALTPVLGPQLGNAVANVVTTQGRDVVKGTTGAGVKKKRVRKSKVEGIGEYTGSGVGKKNSKKEKVSKKSEKDSSTKSAGQAKMAKRNILVKQIMKEKGLNLPQASKYVKEHKLI